MTIEACELDFDTPIRHGKGEGVADDGKVDACLVQRAWLHDAKYKAARKAADEVLQGAFDETIQELRDSALRLFSDMIDLAAAVPA
jgi:hypothetical protein